MSGKSVNPLVADGKAPLELIPVVKKVRKARKPRVPKEKVLKVKMFKWEELSSLYSALIRAEYKYKEWKPKTGAAYYSLNHYMAQKKKDLKLINQLASSIYSVLHKHILDKGENINGNDSKTEDL